MKTLLENGDKVSDTALRVGAKRDAAAELRISECTGDLVGLRTKHPVIEVIREPRLGENFRILLPKEGYEAAYFNSRDQRVSSPTVLVPARSAVVLMEQ